MKHLEKMKFTITVLVAMCLLCAVAAFFLEWVMYDALIGRITVMDTLQMLNFVPFTQLLVPMGAVFLSAGLFVGIVGSWTSIRKFLDV